MASIKKISERKYKITVSNGYRADGRKSVKRKPLQFPKVFLSVGSTSTFPMQQRKWSVQSRTATPRTAR